jgi:hypothetical protein
MTLLLKNWNAIRMLRLSLGIFILYDGIRSHEWFFMAMGAYFTAMALLNIGCFGSQSCAVPKQKSVVSEKPIEVDFEEIHTTQT